MGMSGIVIGLAPALGPTLSGYIIDNYHWRDLFGMVLPIVVLVLVLAFFLMKSVIPLSNPSIDILSAILSTIGFGSLLYGFSSVGDDGWGSLKVIGFLVVGVIFIALFSWRQLHLEHPFLELRVFKSSTFTIAAVLARCNEYGDGRGRNGRAVVYPKHSRRISIPFWLDVVARCFDHGGYDACYRCDFR